MMDCSLLLIAAVWAAATQHSPAAAQAAAQACSLLLTAAVWAAAARYSPSAAPRLSFEPFTRMSLGKIVQTYISLKSLNTS